MKTKGNFMKSQTMEHEIVAMQAKIGQFKGKLSLPRNVEQGGTEKTGDSTNKQRQKRDKAWKKVPPKSDKPMTKKIRNKDFHWCKHHMAWTVHHPRDCKLKDVSTNARDATSPLTNVTKAAATFSAKSIVNLIRSIMGLSVDSDH
jgi:hypothetical protein